MCCGCQRLMDSEGKASIPFALGGFVDVVDANLPELISNPVPLAKTFPDHERADIESRKLGWVVVDGNHRCPECWKREQETKPSDSPSFPGVPGSPVATPWYPESFISPMYPPPHGAYIDLPERAETPVRHETENANGK